MIKLNHDKKEWLKEHARRVVSDSYAEKRKEIDLREAMVFERAKHLHCEKYPQHLLKQVYDICPVVAVEKICKVGVQDFDRLFFIRKAVSDTEREMSGDTIKTSLPVKDEKEIIYTPNNYKCHFYYEEALAVLDDEGNKLYREWQESESEYIRKATGKVDSFVEKIATATTLEDVESKIMPEAAMLREIPEFFSQSWDNKNNKNNMAIIWGLR